eukprot:TRINITY_DN28919_c0_g1_i1.p1 TRINITY_DN28919_c0_g1~~TRINITY_DN28919_c0_g1_i1.p1  ORF type:complete len:109 (-),score=6.75 TRINITY_DN28919_c0_g1_i1:85-411(-)
MTKDTIRYYEELGFLTNISRSNNGYKEYTHAHAEQLILLKRTKELGFTLKEIQTLASLLFTKQLTEDVMTQYLRKKEREIDNTILKLTACKEEIKKHYKVIVSTVNSL